MATAPRAKLASLGPPQHDPLTLFAQHFAAHRATQPKHPDAMVLATATRAAVPSTRVVLLKGVSPRGFEFYSNYRSRKGAELARNPRAALLFFWSELGIQVRIEGKVSKLSAAESDRYWATRPRGSRIGGAASPQSQPLKSADQLPKLVAALEARYPEPGAPPRPGHWGGYALAPQKIEFWYERPSRLHDRTLYQLKKGRWTATRLAP